MDHDIHDHVATCWRHLQEDPRVEALLGLTAGRAAPGAATWRIVMCLIDDQAVSGALFLLANLGLSPGAIEAVLHTSLAGLQAAASWDRSSVSSVIAESAHESAVELAACQQVLAHACLRAANRLPLADVLATMGREWTLARLRGVIEAYRNTQLVG